MTTQRKAWIASSFVFFVGVALWLGLSGSSGSKPEAAKADPPEDLTLGYFDQDLHTFLLIDIGDGNENAGEFLFAVPGVGMFWPDDPATLTPEIDGSITISYSGDGHLDEEAVVDEIFGIMGERSETAATEVSFTVSGTISDDRGTAEMTLDDGVTEYELASAPAPQTASAVVEDTIDYLENESFAALRLQFLEAFRDDVAETPFVTATGGWFAAHGDILDVDQVGSIDYTLNPGDGPQWATVNLEFTFDSGSGNVVYHTTFSYLYYDEAWQLVNIDDFAEDRALMFQMHPGTAENDQPFDVPLTIVVANAEGEWDTADDSTDITLAIDDGPLGAVLTCDGGLTAEVEDGMVEFDGCELDLPGVYVLGASAAGMQSGLSGEITVVATTATVVPGGGPVTLTTVNYGIEAEVAFEIPDSDSYSITMSTADVETGRWFIVNQDGEEMVGEEFYEGEAYFEISPTTNFLDVGAYRLLLTGVQELGSFEVQMFAIPADATDTIAVDGQEHDVDVEVPGQRARFDFTMGSNTSLRLDASIDTPGVTANIELYDDNDNYIGNGDVDSSAGGLYSPPLAAGDYYVIIDPEGPATGQVTVVPTAIADQVESGSIGTPELADLTTAGQNFRLQFSGTASTTVGVDITGSEFDLVRVYIVDPSGAFLPWGSYHFADGATEYIGGIELPSTGTYEVWFVPADGSTGEATVTVVLE